MGGLRERTGYCEWRGNDRRCQFALKSLPRERMREPQGRERETAGAREPEDGTRDREDGGEMEREREEDKPAVRSSASSRAGCPTKVCGMDGKYRDEVKTKEGKAQ